MAAAVRYAAGHGLRIAAQGTGHGAGSLGPLAGTLLLRTDRMRGIRIDPQTRTARVEAGVVWLDVVHAAARHGLAALGGLVARCRRGRLHPRRGHELPWPRLRPVRQQRGGDRGGDRQRPSGAGRPRAEPDLFWAHRGGGGGFGVVTALEFRLFPITQAYAGLLW